MQISLLDIRAAFFIINSQKGLRSNSVGLNRFYLRYRISLLQYEKVNGSFPLTKHMNLFENRRAILENNSQVKKKKKSLKLERDKLPFI